MRTYREARKKINEHFNIKEWHKLDAEIKRDDEEYLGARWNQDIENDLITCDMDRYFNTIEREDEPSRKVDGETELDAKQQKGCRSKVMKLAWPVRHVMPQLAYCISFLSSKLNQATVDDLRKLNLLIDEAKDLQSKGEGKLTFRKLNLDDLVVVTSLDASFAKEAGMKSQCGFISVMTTNEILTKPALCNIVEYSSTRISRVVKSTMAAESAGLSLALDRQLYLRLLIESILYGEPELGPNWRHELKIPGILVTDARSLYDHINKTGSMPTERQTLIDLLIARDLTEAKAITVRWVPTTHQLADVFTKFMRATPIFSKLMTEQLYCLIGNEAETEEARRAGLRKGQRDRRKARMKTLIKQIAHKGTTTTKTTKVTKRVRTTEVDPQ